MTHEQLQQIRDALEHWHEIETASGSVIDYTDELDILDAALAAPVPALQSVSMETVYDTIIEWSTAGKGSRRELARRMIALFAAPQRECETCARKRERLLKAGFLKSPLRTKNEEKPLDESARCKECGSFACGGECVRRYEHG